MTTTIYGIKNCSTMKKAFDKLNELGVEYQFFDYKKQPVDKALVADWINQAGLTKIMNRASQTWRNLSPEQKQSADNVQSAIDLMAAYPSLIKRPIVVQGDRLLIGYKETEFDTLLNS